MKIILCFLLFTAPSVRCTLDGVNLPAVHTSIGSEMLPESNLSNTHPLIAVSQNVCEGLQKTISPLNLSFPKKSSDASHRTVTRGRPHKEVGFLPRNTNRTTQIRMTRNDTRAQIMTQKCRKSVENGSVSKRRNSARNVSSTKRVAPAREVTIGSASQKRGLKLPRMKKQQKEGTLREIIRWSWSESESFGDA